MFCIKLIGFCLKMECVKDEVGAHFRLPNEAEFRFECDDVNIFDGK